MTEKKDSFDRRFVRLLKMSFGLPVRVAVGGFHRLKRLFVTPKSVSELRTDEKARQAGIRRELRGLPTEHHAKSFGPQPS